VEDKAATARMHAYSNRQYLDPVLLGKYPSELKEIFGEAWTVPDDADMQLIRQPVDFIGVNYYSRSVIRHDATQLPFRAARVAQAASPHTDMGWEIYPKGFTDTLTWIKSRYGDIPLYVTENGSAWPDAPAASDGRVEDPLRVEYLENHLKAIHDAIEQGVNLRGYYAWSLLDNYEWSHGYSKRFGIVHVNYETQERTIKDSGRFYSRVIETNGASLG